MKVGLVRGAFLNQYEMQTLELLYPRYQLTGFSSLRPLSTDYKFPLISLFSPLDLPNFPFKMPILNRIFGDAHLLCNLENRLAGFDIAHTAETYFYFTQQCLKAKKMGLVKKVICTVWENIAFNNEGIKLRKEFKRRAISEVDQFIAVTNQAKEALIKEGCPKEKISVIYPGINLNKFKNPAFAKPACRSGRATAGKQKSKIKNTNKKLIKIEILFVGRLVEEKGVWDILQAFRNLEFKIKNLTLKIVGQGKEKNKIKKAINDWGIENKISINQVKYDQMPKIYQGADILVLPSKRTKYWQEQFGMVLIEAMASGLPIIASNSGAIPEIVGEAGLLFKEGDTDDLTEKLVRLINNPELRLELGQKARLRAESEFNAKKQSQKIENIYKKVLTLCHSEPIRHELTASRMLDSESI